MPHQLHSRRKLWSTFITDIMYHVSSDSRCRGGMKEESNGEILSPHLFRTMRDQRQYRTKRSPPLRSVRRLSAPTEHTGIDIAGNNTALLRIPLRGSKTNQIFNK